MDKDQTSQARSDGFKIGFKIHGEIDMTDATILITGANRGIGLKLTEQFATDGWQVLACCRQPDQAGDLQALHRIAGEMAPDEGVARQLIGIAVHRPPSGIVDLQVEVGDILHRIGRQVHSEPGIV